MRPESIRQFEYFFWASIGIALLNNALNLWAGFSMMSAMTTPAYGADQTSNMPAIFLAFGTVVSLLFAVILPAVLAYFAARRASNVARWLLFAFGVIGGLRLLVLLASLLYLIVTHAPTPFVMWVSMALGIFCEILHLSGIAMLFMADAREWFRSGGAPLMEDSVEVFV